MESVDAAEIAEVRSAPARPPRWAGRRDLILMVGLPRSGKSTYAQKAGAAIVSPDAIRKAVHGQGYAPEAEPLIWWMAKAMVHALFVAGHTCVVVDATNNTARRRREWFGPHWTLLYHIVATGADVCRDRALMDGRQDLLPVIDRMDAESDWRGLTEAELLESDQGILGAPDANESDGVAGP